MSRQKTKQISITEYVSKIDPIYFRTNRKNPTANISEEAVRVRIKRGKELPDVIRSDKIGRILVLTVDFNF
jgi:hypothetical protein